MPLVPIKSPEPQTVYSNRTVPNSGARWRIPPDSTNADGRVCVTQSHAKTPSTWNVTDPEGPEIRERGVSTSRWTQSPARDADRVLHRGRVVRFRGGLGFESLVPATSILIHRRGGAHTTSRDTGGLPRQRSRPQTFSGVGENSGTSSKVSEAGFRRVRPCAAGFPSNFPT